MPGSKMKKAGKSLADGIFKLSLIIEKSLGKTIHFLQRFITITYIFNHRVICI